MNIALIESKLNGRGGSQRQVIAYARAFQQLGHEVTLYTIHYDKEKCFSDMLDGLRVVTLPGGFQTPRPIIIPGLGFLNYMRYSRAESNAAQRLAFLIDRNTDILNAHDRVGFRVAVFYKRFVRDIPSVIMMSDILTKSWKAWRKEQFDSKLTRSLQRKFYYWLVDRYEVWKFITPHEGMTVLDNRTRDWARDYFGTQAVVVRSGLDINTFSFIPRNGCVSKRVRVLVTGIFFLHRRYEDVVQAIKLLMDQGYDATLSLVGNYTTSHEYREYHKRLGKLAKDLGIERRVRFYGEVSEEDLRQSYHAHDIYVSPNHLQSWGLAVFEAMASGLPVVVSRTAGASEILTHGENALLVDPKSPEQIAHAIKHLIDDPQLYVKMARAGRTFTEDQVSWEHCAKKTLAVFQDFMSGRVS